MQPSALTNTNLAEVALRLNECERVAICGHVSPDGDCLGSVLALAAGLRQRGKRVSTLLARPDELDEIFCFLDGFEGLLPAADFDEELDVFVAVDAPTRERLGDAAALLDAAPLSVVIDHHETSAPMADLTYAVPDSASTTLLVWQLLKEMGADLTPSVATCAYTGLMTDTGRFQYQNADSCAFAAAAEMVAAGARPDEVSKSFYQSRNLASARLENLAVQRMKLLADGQVALSWLSLADFKAQGAVKADAEPIIDALRAIKGVRVACMLREQEAGAVVRGSLRAKDDTDVASVARELGGGGHRAAAGFTLSVSNGLEEAVALMSERLTRLAGE